MQYQGVLSQLRTAIDAVDANDLSLEDIDALTVLVRRLGTVHARVLASLDAKAAARASGSSVREVRSQRAATRRVAAVPEVAEQVAAGVLSLAAGEVVASNPEVTAQLLSSAAGKDLSELQAEAKQLQDASAPSELERYRRLRQKRNVRSWVDKEGLLNILARLAPDDGAVVLNGLRSHANGLRRAPGASTDAHHADALVDVFKSGPKTSVKTVVNVHVDLGSLERGWVERDGFCEVDGLGPVPVARAQTCFGEAALRVLATADNDLVWAGRSKGPLPQRIRGAVIAHSRGRCASCGERCADVDHVEARTNGGNHDVANLQPLCKACHGDKTVAEVPYAAKYYRDRWPRGRVILLLRRTRASK